MKKRLNILFKYQSKIRIGVLIAFIAITVSSLTVEFFNAIQGDSYFVAHEDEVIYYGSAQLFAETGSLQAESCITEDVSPIGQFNWYGPGYNAVYGSLKKLFGSHHSLFIRFHFFLAMLILVLVFLLPRSLEDNLLTAAIFLITEQFTCYIFSYFPELLHLCFATILVFLLVIIYRREQEGNPTISLVTTYLIVVILFSLCRITTIFWLAALVPLGSTWRQRIPYLLVFGLGIIASVFYLRFFIAPPFAGEMHKLQKLYSFNLWDFVLETFKGVYHNVVIFFSSNSTPIFVLFVLSVFTLFHFWKTKDKFQLAALLVTLCLVGTLMAYYSVNPFYFVKQTAMLLPLLVVAFMRGPFRVAKWTLFLVLIFFWVPVNKKRSSVIKEHKAAFANFKNNSALQADFEQIRDHVERNKDIVILWCYNEFEYGNAVQALLPYSTKTQNPIMYTTNIVASDSPATEKFKLHGKLKVNYMLSRNQILDTTLLQVLRTDHFFMYQLGAKTAPK
jgi:hypothetical protein